MVQHLVQYCRPAANRRIRIHPDRIYIYGNDVDTVQQRNAATNTNLSAQPGLDCVPLCIQWLRTVAEAWQYDPQEWLECDLSYPGRVTQNGALPMPLGSTTAALDTASPAQIQAAGWERLRS
jgi:hypothetical protein